MKKTKIKERFENAVEAFFCETNLNKIDDSKFECATANADFKEKESFFSKHKTFFNIARHLLLFAPGAFGLFFMSVAFTGFCILRPPIGEEHHLFLGLVLLSFSALLTFVGLGNCRNPKHLIIPASIVSPSMILGVICSFTHGVESYRQISGLFCSSGFYFADFGEKLD